MVSTDTRRIHFIFLFKARKNYRNLKLAIESREKTRKLLGDEALPATIPPGSKASKLLGSPAITKQKRNIIPRHKERNRSPPPKNRKETNEGSAEWRKGMMGMKNRLQRSQSSDVVTDPIPTPSLSPRKEYVAAPDVEVDVAAPVPVAAPPLPPKPSSKPKLPPKPQKKSVKRE